MTTFFLSIMLFIAALYSDESYAATSSVNISATVRSLNQCKIKTDIPLLDLGRLDTERALDRTASTSITFKCDSSDDSVLFSISEDDGQGIGRQMRHATRSDAVIPYTLSMRYPDTAVKSEIGQDISVSVKVKGTDYRGIYSGGYSDVVFISIAP